MDTKPGTGTDKTSSELRAAVPFPGSPYVKSMDDDGTFEPIEEMKRDFPLLWATVEEMKTTEQPLFTSTSTTKSTMS